MNMDEYITIDELARKLNVSRGYLYNLCYQGKIPHRKIGRLVRFVPSEIEDWIDSNTEQVAIDGKHL